VVFTIKKGEKTKKHIIEQTAILMNQRGFIATPLSEIMEVTGMQKGGLYNHFKDKEELALQAFDHCYAINKARVEEMLLGKTTVNERLTAFIEAYCGLSEDPLLPGGCPIMNAGVEAADGQSLKLQARAQNAMQYLLDFIAETLATGIINQEIQADVDPKQTATIIMATIEGAVLLSKLSQDISHILIVKNHLLAFIKSKQA